MSGSLFLLTLLYYLPFSNSDCFSFLVSYCILLYKKEIKVLLLGQVARGLKTRMQFRWRKDLINTLLLFMFLLNLNCQHLCVNWHQLHIHRPWAFFLLEFLLVSFEKNTPSFLCQNQHFISGQSLWTIQKGVISLSGGRQCGSSFTFSNKIMSICIVGRMDSSVWQLSDGTGQLAPPRFGRSFHASRSFRGFTNFYLCRCIHRFHPTN